MTTSPPMERLWIAAAGRRVKHPNIDPRWSRSALDPSRMLGPADPTRRGRQ